MRSERAFTDASDTIEFAGFYGKINCNIRYIHVDASGNLNFKKRFEISPPKGHFQHKFMPCCMPGKHCARLLDIMLIFRASTFTIFFVFTLCFFSWSLPDSSVSSSARIILKTLAFNRNYIEERSGRDNSKREISAAAPRIPFKCICFCGIRPGT